jgi:ParB family transcriptional regulator, chromosome partitioning protein
MAAHPRGLGRGLGALLHDMETSARSGPEVKLIALSEIFPNPHQPRQTFSEDSLRELADSIRSQGVLQPVLVRPGKPQGTYELIAGERRLRACALAQVDHIPALIREISDEESIAIALIENLQREDLNPLEEALALGHLKDRLGLSQEELAIRVGRSRPAVANGLRLLQLAPAVQEDLRAGRITAGHGRAIVAIDGGEAQIELSKRVQAKGLNVRQTEELAAQYKRRSSFSAPSIAVAPGETLFQQSLRQSLATDFPCPVQFRGNRRKGSITMRYSTPEELKALLVRLGVNGETQG